MTDYDRLRGAIFSRKGGWKIGSGIETHGYSLLDEIHGKCSLFQVMILNVTGRLPEKRLADVVEGVFICSSWPDPRIWCNKLGAFSAMTRTTPTAAVAAGGLAGDSKLYGVGTGRSIESFITLADRMINHENWSVQEFMEKHAFSNGKLQAPGFARPLAKGDERVVAMRRYARELGFETGRFEKLANEMEDYLSTKAGEGLNSSGYFVVFMKDQGYSIDEIIGIAAWAISTGVYASYFEYIAQAPEAFLPLRISDIDYTGPEVRKTPVRDD